VVFPFSQRHRRETNRPIPNPDVVLAEGVDGWAVLINLDTSRSVALNPTGIVVWKLPDGRRCFDDVIAAVARHYRDVPDTATSDVVALLDMLAEEGLVGEEWVPAASA